MIKSLLTIFVMKKWFNFSPQLYRNFIICCNLVDTWEVNRSKWHHRRMCPSRYFVTEPWKNLGVNLNKVVCLSWNLVPILIRIYRIRWFDGDVHFFQTRNTTANSVQKIKIFCLSSNLVLRLIRICRIRWIWSLFVC